MPHSDLPVLIVGAGPTGLVLALWLTRLGIPVRIIDRNAEAGGTSRALAVQARTLEFYRQLGIADGVVSGGVKVANINFWVKSAPVARVPLRRIGEGMSPYPFALVYPQDDHERLLIQRLGDLDVQVERRTELLRFEQDDDGVRATLRGPDGVESVCDAAYLAGCDGASSTVRRELGIGFPGGTYTGLFFVADVEASGPAINDELHVDLEDADFLLVFPMKGEARVRLVGIVHGHAGSDADVLEFDDVRAKVVHHLRLGVGRVNWFSTYRVHHRVANRFRAARVFLLGDAAHIHSPVGGQGMNTGIGDAVNLAWKLAAVLRNQMAGDLLDSYEQERIPFAQRLVATTDRAFTFVTRRSAVSRFVRTRVAPLVVPLLFRIPPVRRAMFETVSQILIHYRDSSLSDGQAAEVRGGDRLPWIDLGTERDNFAPLASLAWQVHIYGEAAPGVSEACQALQLPLHVFGWRPRMQSAGLAEGALYLIRPDGYVALADAHADVDRLGAYFRARSPARQ